MLMLNTGDPDQVIQMLIAFADGEKDENSSSILVSPISAKDSKASSGHYIYTIGSVTLIGLAASTGRRKIDAMVAAGVFHILFLNYYVIFMFFYIIST